MYEYVKENPFRYYLDCLNGLNKLSDDEKALRKTKRKSSLIKIETEKIL